MHSLGSVVIQAGFVKPVVVVVVVVWGFEDAPDLSMNKIPFGIERENGGFHVVVKSLAVAASGECYS